jgi:hypothetical protein
MVTPEADRHDLGDGDAGSRPSSAAHLTSAHSAPRIGLAVKSEEEERPFMGSSKL